MTDLQVAVVASACLLAGVLMGVFVGSFFESRLWHKDAVSRKVARYCPETGKWEWTVEKNNE